MSYGKRLKEIRAALREGRTSDALHTVDVMLEHYKNHHKRKNRKKK